MAANAGWVNVGTDGDTFAVESIRRWWQAVGKPGDPGATRLLITADAGGSNGYRTRAWKAELAALAALAGLDIIVCHFPPGTSKWNKIEHRLFSAISMNWRGRPLTSHEVITQTIAATTTRTGLTVQAELDTGLYPTGVKISDQQMAALPITRHHFHHDWNYTLHPHAGQTRGPAEPGPEAATGWDRTTLACPALTGLPRKDLDDLAAALTGPRSEQREQDLHQRRGSDRQRAPGAGPPAQADARRPGPGHLPPPAPRPSLPSAGSAARGEPDHHQPGDPRDPAATDRHGLTAGQPAARLYTLADISAYAARQGITPRPESKSAC